MDSVGGVEVHPCAVVFEFTNYRTYLRAVLTERAQKNPRYSMRAMARAFGLSHSMISQVVRGQANLSTGAARKIAGNLKLDPKETEYLCLLIDFDAATDPTSREYVLARMRALNPSVGPAHDLGVDEFRQMADWQHNAILELCRLPGFSATPGNIATRIGISMTEAQASADRLVRLGMLTHQSSGRYARIPKRYLVSSSQSNAGLKQFYRQMLTKAEDAIEEQTPSERVSGFETFAIARESLPEVRAATDRYLNELQAIASKNTQYSEVYHALVHVFGLSAKGANS